MNTCTNTAHLGRQELRAFPSARSSRLQLRPHTPNLGFFASIILYPCRLYPAKQISFGNVRSLLWVLMLGFILFHPLCIGLTIFTLQLFMV